MLVFEMVWGGNTYRAGNPKPLIPTVGQTTPGFEGNFVETVQDYFWHMLLPSTALILIGFAGYSRYMRASMLDVMSSDYVRTARAKGISEAMNCTAFGLMIALLSLIGYALLNGKTQALNDDINEATVQVLNLVVNNRAKVNLQSVPAAA